MVQLSNHTICGHKAVGQYMLALITWKASLPQQTGCSSRQTLNPVYIPTDWQHRDWVDIKKERPIPCPRAHHLLEETGTHLNDRHKFQSTELSSRFSDIGLAGKVIG